MIVKGHSVSVLAPHYKGAKTKETVDGVTVYRFRYWFTEKGETLTYEGAAVEKVNKSPIYILKLMMYMSSMLVYTVFISVNNKIDIINAHWLIPQGFIAVIAKYIFRKPVLVTIHGSDVFALNNRMLLKFKGWTLKYADKVVSNSSATLDAVKGIFPRSDYVVIPMGVDVRRFSPVKKTNNKGGRIKLVYAGRLSVEKGPIHLLKAMKILQEQGYAVELFIAGSGTEEESLRDYATRNELSNVRFLGWVNHSNLPKLYSDADAVVGPSLREALGLAFAEAMACGTPVVATDVGGIRDVVIDGKNGYIVEPGSPEALAMKLAYVIDHPEGLKKMGLKARQHVVDNFAWESVADSYNEQIVQLTPSH